MHKVFGEESWQAVWAACICTGVLFGAAHLSNIFERNISVSAAVVQATVGLALVYLLPALIVLRPKKVRPLLGKVVI